MGLCIQSPEQQTVKAMGGAVPVQDFPRPIVEHGLHPFDCSSREPIESCALGEKLAQQSVDVLIGPSLPGTMQVRKIDVHLRLPREEAVLTHYWTLVVRERAADLGRHVRSRGRRPASIAANQCSAAAQPNEFGAWFMGRLSLSSRFRWTCSPTGNPFWFLESLTRIRRNQLVAETLSRRVAGLPSRFVSRISSFVRS
ncbi:MAG: hypothetical protein EWM73_03365 [Nitrospira sp.]|nr:MAG: hypothetical protein EWM73_03365 [Nitrospira sp.]